MVRKLGLDDEADVHGFPPRHVRCGATTSRCGKEFVAVGGGGETYNPLIILEILDKVPLGKADFQNLLP